MTSFFLIIKIHYIESPTGGNAHGAPDNGLQRSGKARAGGSSGWGEELEVEARREREILMEQRRTLRGARHRVLSELELLGGVFFMMAWTVKLKKVKNV